MEEIQMTNGDFKEYWDNLSFEGKLKFIKITKELDIPLEKYQQELVDEFIGEFLDTVRSIMENTISKLRNLLLDEEFINALNETLKDLEGN